MRGSPVQIRPVAPEALLTRVSSRNSQINASLAQLVEQLTLNQFVVGSNPTRGTI